MVFNGEKALRTNKAQPVLRYVTARQAVATSTRKCLGLVGDQLVQEENQHDERNTDRKAAGRATTTHAQRA